MVAGFAYTLVVFALSLIVTAWLWDYRAILNEGIWVFLGIFTVLSIWFGIMFYLIFGREPPDVRM